MKQKTAFLILVLSCAFSFWLYSDSDAKIEQKLISREWHSQSENYLSDKIQEKNSKNELNHLSKVIIKSNVKYLPNNTYQRFSFIELHSNETSNFSNINISETGTWELSDNYILITPTEFKDMTTPREQAFTEEQIDGFKNIFIMDAHQSQRVDIINSKAILLTSLAHGSRILSSN